ncbi:amylo-alpha-1,6-glucosidase [Trichothermofontia sichuanensis B231]|uniref:amylo-alpha-1,6-glucosidase n=1 Tax=Trichothermofontia sichuanensis TaxID=3045816 RepID=UPI00224657A4|nr:amylo-alpha-1,6-glucosidase [Trichothermofontia sichuanensis]UZQ55296.1 amylo-alpha-1,6-glucosidase [Trichothermofontia sichuanensis B231]
MNNPAAAFDPLTPTSAEEMATSKADAPTPGSSSPAAAASAPDAPVPVLELGDGRTFTPAPTASDTEWPCTRGRRQQTTLTLKDNDIFLITDPLGNITCFDREDEARLGLFCRDTRFLSRLELQFERQPLVLLSSSAQRGFALSAQCANPGTPQIPPETVSIQRELVLQGGVLEELTLTNYGQQPVSFELSLTFDADFADLFEIRGWVRQRTGLRMRSLTSSPPSPPSESTPPSPLPTPPQALVLAYRGVDGVFMESRIAFYRRQPDRLEGYTAIWHLCLPPHGTEVLGYRLQPVVDNQPASSVSIPATLTQALAAETMVMQQWQDCTTHFQTDDRPLQQILDRATQDIYLLQQTFPLGKATGQTGRALSAGIPWFSTLFGRDALIAAMQTLILNPEIARQTLTVLAAYQGQAVNEWRDEEPGKILHELRRGEMARCGEIPHDPYYGTVDATPLWLMLYADYYAWTGDRAFVEQYWPQAEAAMAWIDRNCAASGGYLTYERKSAGGLRNQGWKDSEDCIVNAKGELATGAIALAEVQGYVYAARMRLSQLAQVLQKPDLRDRWQQAAQTLKAQFERDFWLPEQGYFALALDGNGQPMDSITSNPGQCLGLGLFSRDQAQSVAERLRAPDLFNGWGIRTLSSASPAYNPMGYHLGSVWPHDSGLIALGLRSLGYTEQALEIAQGLLDMTAQQPYCRPPELFCGFARTADSPPVRYPVACSPQAWATGSIFHLIQVMVNLVPDAPNNCLRVVNPTLLPGIHYLSLRNLRIGQTWLDLEFEQANGATACRVVQKRGNLRVIIEA